MFVNFIKLIISNILTLLEIILFRKINLFNSTIETLEKDGWVRLENNFKELFPIDYETIKYHSPYSSLIILNTRNIDKLIKNIFLESNIFDILEKEMKMKYCIDFFLFWETRNIPLNNEKDQYFANLWHRDTLFSKNVLKLFILTHDTDTKNGPITWLDKNASLEFNDRLINEKNNQSMREIINSFTGKQGDTCIINPNICLHKAGNPDLNSKRRMMMFQLNPSYKNSWRNDLYEKQFFLEPNLPLVKNIFRGKKTI